MSETKWNKKIDFSPNQETTEPPPSDTIQEGFEEVDEMIHKLKQMRDKKKGFTKLPFLQSIYDSVAPEPMLNSTESEKDKVGPMKYSSEPVKEPIEEPAKEPVIEGMTDTTKKYQYTMRYIADLTYNLSFDVFAYSIFQITNGKQPKYPGKPPKQPKGNATKEARDTYNKQKKEYDKKMPLYNDKKIIASMGNRILTCLISIFITYNLYFSYSTPSVPGSKTTFETIIDWIEALPVIFFPIKCAITPANMFLKMMSFIDTIMKLIPLQPLLFGLCMAIAFTFVYSGIARQFVDMVLSVVDPVGAYGDTKSADGFAKKHSNDILLIAIVFGCIITNVLKVCMDFKNPSPITQIPALLMWLIVFGLSLVFLPIGKVAIAIIVFYLCMLSMINDEKNGINILQTMTDIDEKLIGPQTIYECGDENSFKNILEKLSKFISGFVINNLYIFTVIPIAIINIQKSASISSANVKAKSFANFLSSMIILIVLSSNKTFTTMYNWVIQKIMGTEF